MDVYILYIYNILHITVYIYNILYNKFNGHQFHVVKRQSFFRILIRILPKGSSSTTINSNDVYSGGMAKLSTHVHTLH